MAKIIYFVQIYVVRDRFRPKPMTSPALKSLLPQSILKKRIIENLTLSIEEFLRGATRNVQAIRGIRVRRRRVSHYLIHACLSVH